MVLSAIMGIGCVGLIVCLYIISGGWKSNGGLRGIWKWLSQGGLSNPNVRTKQAANRDVPDPAGVADILEDIYQEFTTKLSKQGEELDRKLTNSLLELRQAVESLEERVAKCEEGNRFEFVANPPPPVLDNVLEELCDDGREPVYFRILDELRKGIGPDEVASRLEISVYDVKRVLDIMESPKNLS